MRNHLGHFCIAFLFAAACASATASQYDYGVSVTVKFSAQKGKVPTEKRIVLPEFPPEMRRAGMTQDVDFSLTVLGNGKVADVAVKRTNTQPKEFRDAVETAIAGWTFASQPSGPSEAKRPCHLSGTIQFRLIEE